MLKPVWESSVLAKILMIRWHKTKPALFVLKVGNRNVYLALIC